MNLDARVSELVEFLRQAGLDALGTIPASEMRQRLARIRARGSSTPHVDHVEDMVVPSPTSPVPVRLYRGVKIPRALFIYMHGGGWCLGSVDEHDNLLRRLAARTHATFISVDYRLAPEHPFPAAVEDALTVVRWATRHVHDLIGHPEPIVIGGDSAGANLAAVVSQVVNGSDDHIAGTVLIYPCLDGDIDAPSLRRFEPPLLTHAQLAWFFDQYVPERAQRVDTRFAPLRAHSLTGLPPTLLLTAEHDILREEADRYADRLKAAACEVKSICYPGMVHGFFALGDLLEAGMVRDEISSFIDYVRGNNNFPDSGERNECSESAS